MQAAELPQRQQAARDQEEHTVQPGPEGEPLPAITAGVSVVATLILGPVIAPG